MRNKIKIISLALLAAFAFGSFASAQERRGTTPQEERQEANAPSRADRLKALKNLVQAQINRTEKALEKLSSILNRIEEIKPESASLDRKLAQAKALEQEARSQLAAVKEKYSSIDPNEPRRSVQAFMKEIKALKATLIELHKSLRSIIADIKKLEERQDN